MYVSGRSKTASGSSCSVAPDHSSRVTPALPSTDKYSYSFAPRSAGSDVSALCDTSSVVTANSIGASPSCSVAISLCAARTTSSVAMSDSPFGSADSRLLLTSSSRRLDSCAMRAGNAVSRLSLTSSTCSSDCSSSTAGRVVSPAPLQSNRRAAGVPVRRSARRCCSSATRGDTRTSAASSRASRDSRLTNMPTLSLISVRPRPRRSSEATRSRWQLAGASKPAARNTLSCAATPPHRGPTASAQSASVVAMRTMVAVQSATTANSLTTTSTTRSTGCNRRHASRYHGSAT
mmetsp:Transcript_19531/g.69142  ORF Transcript_19531/g.69142 Transcript_19531/m.69142 type:complete len:291 (+) Transcript_19531:911-1783(+)